MAKFNIGDSVQANGKDATVWAIHTYADKVLYSVTFADGTTGRDVIEGDVDFSEVEKLRREVDALKKQIAADRAAKSLMDEYKRSSDQCKPLWPIRQTEPYWLGDPQIRWPHGTVLC
jgi:hypothetical protein